MKPMILALLGMTALAGPLSAATYQLDFNTEIFAGEGSYGFGGPSVDMLGTAWSWGNGTTTPASLDAVFNPGGTTTLQTTTLTADGISVSGSTHGFSEARFSFDGIEIDPVAVPYMAGQIWTQMIKMVTSGFVSVTAGDDEWAGVGYTIEVMDLVSGAVYDTLDRGGLTNPNDWQRVLGGAQAKGGLFVQCGGHASGAFTDVDIFELMLAVPNPGPMQIEGVVRGMTGPADCDTGMKYVLGDAAAAGAQIDFALPAIAPVPLPASGLLMLAGAGVAGAFARARRRPASAR